MSADDLKPDTDEMLESAQAKLEAKRAELGVNGEYKKVEIELPKPVHIVEVTNVAEPDTLGPVGDFEPPPIDLINRDWSKERNAPPRYHGLDPDSWKPELSRGIKLTDWWKRLNPWALVLLGPCGTGKSHYATIQFNMALQKLAEEGWPNFGHWISWPAILENIKSEFNTSFSGRSKGRLTARVVLLLDDVGASRGTEFNDDLLRSTLLFRYDQKLPTIITSNADDLSAFDDHFPRVASRFAEGEVVIFDGDDRRLG